MRFSVVVLNTKSLSIGIIWILALILSCKDEDPVPTTISSISVESIGDSLYFTAKLSSPNPAEIEYMGFAIGETEGPHIGATDARYTGEIRNGYLRVSRINFDDDRVHYCRPFVKTKNEFIYGEDLTFYGLLYDGIKIHDFSPKSGKEGDFVKIFGSGYGLTGDGIRVFFGTKEAQIQSITTEQIIVTVPGYKLVEQLPITVQRSQEIVEASVFFDLLGPRITSFDPHEGSEWITIKIKGSQFSDVTWRNSVTIGLYSMEVLTASPTEITARINTRKLMPGEYKIGVTVDARTGIATELFEVSTPWQALTAKPNGGFCLSTQFVIGHKAYVCTGIPTRWNSGFQYTMEVWEYDMLADQWTQRADFPGEARIEAVGFSINGKGYVATGYTTQTVSDLWEYDPSTNQWTQKASIPDGARNGASAFTYQSKGYVIFGTPKWGGLPDRKDFWEYDPVNDKWTQLPDFAGKGRYNAKVVVRGDNLYVAGGVSYYDYFNPDLWRYNFTTQTWTSLGEIDFAPEAMYTYEDKVHVISHEADYFGNHQLVHFQLDPDTNKRIKECYIFPGFFRDRTTFNVVFNNEFYFGMGIDDWGYYATYDCLGDIWKLELKYN